MQGGRGLQLCLLCVALRYTQGQAGQQPPLIGAAALLLPPLNALRVRNEYTAVWRLLSDF